MSTDDRPRLTRPTGAVHSGEAGGASSSAIPSHCRWRMARNQLSVRHYVTLVVMLCAPLVLWGLYVMIFTESMSVGPAKVGQPIVVRGRYPKWYGRDYIVTVSRADSPDEVSGSEERSGVDGDGTGSFWQGRATRSWLGYYQFEMTIGPINDVGDYEVFFDAVEHSPSTLWAPITVSP